MKIAAFFLCRSWAAYTNRVVPARFLGRGRYPLSRLAGTKEPSPDVAALTLFSARAALYILFYITTKG